MDITDLTGRTALVTGAASGIGRETALAFARRGADLALCDLDKDGLDETQAKIRVIGRGECTGHIVDVANALQMETFAAAVHERVPAVDILVNNAGVGLGGGFLDTSLEDWNWIVGINLMGVVHGCHYFVPKMVERGTGGHVVNVSSAAGYTAGEALSAYSTTKFGVLGLSEALRDELARRDIGVTAICPGIIDTAITRTSRMVGPMATEAQRDQMIATYQKRGYGPERVAAGILHAIEKNRRVAPVSPEAWGLYYLKRFAPGLLAWLGSKAGARARRQAGLSE